MLTLFDDVQLEERKERTSSLMRHPSVIQVTAEERERKEAIAFEIGELLKRMDGNRSTEPHKSAGFHRKVAFLMPEKDIREALSSTRDAVDDQNAGKIAIHDISGLFGGIIKGKAGD